MTFTKLTGATLLALTLGVGMTGCGSDGGSSDDKPAAETKPKSLTVAPAAVPQGASATNLTLANGSPAISVDSKGSAGLASYAGFATKVALTKAPVTAVQVNLLNVEDVTDDLINEIKTYLKSRLDSGGFDILISKSVWGRESKTAIREVEITLDAQQTVASLREELVENVITEADESLPQDATKQTNAFRIRLVVNSYGMRLLAVYPREAVVDNDLNDGIKEKNIAAPFMQLNSGFAFTYSNNTTRIKTTGTFTQGQAINEADVLLVIDNSASMGQEQQTVADASQLLFDKLNNTSLNYHLGVATTGRDGSVQCYELAELTTAGDRFITPNTANAKTEFETIAKPGTGGSGNETGLYCAEQTFQDPTSTNTGFDRSNAPNVVLILSDEVDHETMKQAIPTGANTNYTAQNLEHYINYFTKTKPATIFTIVGPGKQPRLTFNDPVPATGSCSSSYGNASGGANYGLLSQKTGGSRASICVDPSSYTTIMNQLVSAATGLGSQYQLKNLPIAGTVTVKVDGTNVVYDPNHQNGFDVIYSRSGASVVFYGTAIPAAGSKVTIPYLHL